VGVGVDGLTEGDGDMGGLTEGSGDTGGLVELGAGLSPTDVGGALQLPKLSTRRLARQPVRLT